jgi:hypothetical protein
MHLLEFGVAAYLFFCGCYVFHLGTTITSSFSLCNRLLSSSLVWAMLRHYLHNNGICLQLTLAFDASKFHGIYIN